MEVVINTSKDNMWIGKCNSCKSIVKASGKDIDMRYLPYANDGKRAWNVCPVCGAGRERTTYYFLPTKQGIEIMKEAEEIMAGDRAPA